MSHQHHKKNKLATIPAKSLPTHLLCKNLSYANSKQVIQGTLPVNSLLGHKNKIHSLYSVPTLTKPPHVFNTLCHKNKNHPAQIVINSLCTNLSPITPKALGNRNKIHSPHSVLTSTRPPHISHTLGHRNKSHTTQKVINSIYTNLSPSPPKDLGHRNKIHRPHTVSTPTKAPPHIIHNLGHMRKNHTTPIIITAIYTNRIPKTPKNQDHRNKLHSTHSAPIPTKPPPPAYIQHFETQKYKPHCTESHPIN